MSNALFGVKAREPSQVPPAGRARSHGDNPAGPGPGAGAAIGPGPPRGVQPGAGPAALRARRRLGRYSLNLTWQLRDSAGRARVTESTLGPGSFSSESAGSAAEPGGSATRRGGPAGVGVALGAYNRD
eukprot:752670-Hanusia_phi.AAC.1